MIRALGPAALVLLLAACGGGAPAPGGNDQGAAPEPAASGDTDIDLSPVTLIYRCDDKTVLTAVFDNRVGNLTLREGGKTLGVLDSQPAASGIWYAGDGMTLRGKGREASFERPGHAETNCVADE